VSLVEARGLLVRRGRRVILAGVDLQADAGEFVAVIGPNGAGKSTLLAVLAGLLAPDAGEVSFAGRSLARFDPGELARRRAYLPQSPRCEWPIPVERLVALGLTPDLPAFGGLAEGQRRAVDAALAACDLVERRGQPATTLSGGELARAMLARALVAEPAVLIVDEPLAGLDPRHAIDSVRRLRQLADDGCLVIAAIHDLNLARRASTRVVGLRDGRVLADGPAHEMLTPELVEALFDVQARLAPDGAQGQIVLV
jgi:iron complex transport system ATP-binding protein